MTHPTQIALYSIDLETPAIAHVYGLNEAEIADAELGRYTSEGRIMTTKRLIGEDAEFALKLYDIALDHLFDHQDSLPLTSTAAGRAYLTARDRLHNFLCT